MGFRSGREAVRARQVVADLPTTLRIALLAALAGALSACAGTQAAQHTHTLLARAISAL